jgi:hypothetical protein
MQWLVALGYSIQIKVEKAKKPRLEVAVAL